MKRPLCLLCLTFVVILAACMYRMPVPVPDYQNLDGQELIVQGQVYRKEYKERYDSGKIPVIYLKSVHILNGFNQESDEFWKVHFQQFPNYQFKNIVCYMDAESYGEKKGEKLPKMGETIQVSGRVRSFSHATNPGEFDMAEYYSIMKLEFALEKTKVQAAGGESQIVQESLYQLRQIFAGILEEIFPPKEASVMKAILLGDKNGLDTEIKELYQQNQIIHILSVSGLHFSVIGMGIYRLLRKAGTSVKIAAGISMVLIYAYGLMTGMGMSTVRAVIMIGIHLLADMVGRTYDMLTALALAAVLLLIEQPRYVQYSGFLFSFGAVLAIGILLPALYEPGRKKKCNEKKRFLNLFLKYFMERPEGIRQAAASGIAVTLMTLPVQLMNYYQFPLHSIVLNLMVIPLMSVLMGAGLMVMLIGGFCPLFAKGVSLINRIILWFYEVCCRMGSACTVGVLVCGKPEDWQVIGYILLLGIMVWLIQISEKKLPGFWKLQWILAALCILIWRSDDGGQITILDVGQGDCIHMRSAEGKHYLMDGGSSDKSQVMQYRILPYLKSEGVSHLDMVFLSHPDNDHCNGIMKLLQDYPADGITIGSLVLPHIAEESKDKQYKEIEHLAKQNGILVQYMSRGQKVEDGEMTIRCLHPYKDYKTENANEYSLVLLVNEKDFSGLFTGDVEGAGEESMCEYMRECMRSEVQEYELTLLKVAHHGSRYSTSEELLELIDAKLAIISCGKKNRYNHPHKETLERLKEDGSTVLTTQEYGAIRINIGKDMRIESYGSYQ